MKKTIPLILAASGLAVAGFSALAESGESNAAGPGSLPEIPAAEGDLAEKCLTLGLELSRRNAFYADQPPAEKVEALIATLEDLKPQVKALEEDAQALNALYDTHGVTKTSVDEQFTERAAQVCVTGSITEQRQLALDYELAKLREVHADDPEALREAISLWHESNFEELASLESARAEQSAMDSEENASATRPEANSNPDMSSQLTSRGEVIDGLEASLAAYPPPAPNADGSPSDQAMEAWSNAAYTEHEPILRQLEEINAAVALENARQTAQSARQ